MNKQPT